MCHRIFVPKSEDFPMIRDVLEDLERRGIRVDTGELGPGSTAAVMASGKDGTPRPFAMYWGYRLPNGKLVFNTRSETAAEKPMFADGIAQRRCLIPAAHYYEWDTEKKKYEIAPAGGAGFWLAGIYRFEEGKPVFSILTRTPAKEIAFIHDRMPVILPDSVKAAWLNPGENGAELLRQAADGMRFCPSAD